MSIFGGQIPEPTKRVKKPENVVITDLKILISGSMIQLQNEKRPDKTSLHSEFLHKVLHRSFENLCKSLIINS